MEPVSHVSRLLETLRKQLNEQLGTENTGTKTSSPRPAGNARPDLVELQKKFAGKLHALDPVDPRFHTKATRIFLETVLSWEFGDHLKQDPKFYALIDDVQAALEEDADTRREFASLFKQLR